MFKKVIILAVAFALMLPAVVKGAVPGTTRAGWTIYDSGSDLQPSDHLFGVYFVDADTGWIVGQNATILRTTDGGVTWTAPLVNPAPADSILLEPYFVDANTGWIVGTEAVPEGQTAGEIILRTINGGVTWEFIQTDQTDYGLEDVHFVDASYGWAVSENGTILYTADGGGTWTAQTQNVNWIAPEAPFHLYGVYFNDDTCSGGDMTNCEGWAVGGGGTILHTINGGAGWEQQQIFSGAGNLMAWGFFSLGDLSKDLRDIGFLNATTGWAMGDGFIRTTDGGDTWTYINQGTALHAIHFVDGTGWIVGGLELEIMPGVILLNIDGGTNWTSQIEQREQDQDFKQMFPAPYRLNDVHFTDARNGWAVGNGGIILKYTPVCGNNEVAPGEECDDGNLVSYDGCSDDCRQEVLGWHEVPPPAGTSFPWFHNVYFVGKHGWAVGTNGGILHTIDGGLNWSHQTSGTLNRLFGVHFIDDAACLADWHNCEGWAVGLTGTILHTTNGGEAGEGGWTPQDSGISNLLRDVHFVDVNHGWAVSNGGEIINTINGGVNWNTQADINKNLRDVHFVNENTGWAVGAQGHVVKTVNGGENWIKFWDEYGVPDFDGNENNDGDFAGVYFVNETHGWVVGYGRSDVDQRALILYTTDGGEAWIKQTTSRDDYLKAVYFIEDTCSGDMATCKGWAVGDGGTILHTTDGGTTWEPQTNPMGVGDNILGVHSVDETHGSAVNEYGDILRYGYGTPPSP